MTVEAIEDLIVKATGGVLATTFIRRIAEAIYDGVHNKMGVPPELETNMRELKDHCKASIDIIDRSL